MSGRSTRNKIRHQLSMLIADTDKLMIHLHKIDVLGEQQSPFINDTLPILVDAVDALQKIIEYFKDNI